MFNLQINNYGLFGAVVEKLDKAVVTPALVTDNIQKRIKRDLELHSIIY